MLFELWNKKRNLNFTMCWALFMRQDGKKEVGKRLRKQIQGTL